MDLLGGLPYETNGFRVGVITFSDTPETVLRLSEGTNRKTIVNSVSSIKYTGGGTRTAAAVDMAIGMLVSEGRSDASKVVVLMNDGRSADEWQTVLKTAEELRSVASDVFAVALTANPDLDELAVYTGSDGNIYRNTGLSSRLNDIIHSTRSCYSAKQHDQPIKGALRTLST